MYHLGQPDKNVKSQEEFMMRVSLIIFCAIFAQHYDVAASPTKVVRLTLPAKVLVVKPEPVDVIVEVATSATTPVVKEPVPVTTEEPTTAVVIPSIVVNSTDILTVKHKVIYVDKDFFLVRWGGCGYKGLCG